MSRATAAYEGARLLPAEDAARLLAVVQELAYVRDLAGVMAVVRRTVRDLTGADGTTFVLREGDLVHYAEENAVGPLWKGRRFPASACISGWAMIHRESVAIEDIYADARIPHDAYRPTFVRSLAMVPVRRDDPVAAIGAYWATRHKATARELGVLEALADTVAIALQNAELWERSRRAVQARDEFIGIASHELKTPLTPLVLQVGALQRLVDRGEGGESLRREVARVGDHVQRLSRLVEALLDLSGLAAGEVQLSTEDVELEPVVARVVERLRPQLQRSGSALAVSVAPGLAGRWDPRRVEQILESLLSNAARYGEGKPVEVFATRSGDHAEIVVRDRGMGIPAEAQARLFQPFERAVPATHFGGFGMGLWLARQLSEAHGGAIRVASRPGEGSVFTVTLPLAEAHRRASRHLDQTAPAP